jgi:hypothetical protein
VLLVTCDLFSEGKSNYTLNPTHIKFIAKLFFMYLYGHTEMFFFCAYQVLLLFASRMISTQYVQKWETNICHKWKCICDVHIEEINMVVF